MAVTLGAGGIVFPDGTTESDVRVDTGSLISMTTFTTSGTYVVPGGSSSIFVRLVGGGGGGCGYCESGGAGGYSEIFLTGIAPGTGIAVTIGAGGAGTAYYSAAGAGGTTSFGPYCSATGGYGANNNYGHTGGHGGVGVGGQVNLSGGSGHSHGNSHSSAGTAKGGASYYGCGPMTRHSGGEQIGPGAPGAGAAGQTTDGTGSQVGHYGAAGIVTVYAYH